MVAGKRRKRKGSRGGILENRETNTVVTQWITVCDGLALVSSGSPYKNKTITGERETGFLALSSP